MGEDTIAGPFAAEALTFYYVHAGGPLEIRLSAQAGGREGRILYRFYDVAENLVKWDYERIAAGSAKEWTRDFGEEAPPGIYQVRYAGRGIAVETEASPATAFGWSPSRCMISVAAAGQYRSAWLKVPHGTEQFTVSAIGLSGHLYGRQEEAIASFRRGAPAVVDARKRGGDMLRINIDSPVGSYYRFGIAGMDPVVLGDSPETLQAIFDGFLRNADGTIVPHRFQANIRNWIDELRAEDLAVDLVDWSEFVDAWMAYPQEARGLLSRWGAFSHLHFLLQDQHVDPASTEFGRFGLRAVPATLALAYSLDRPYNPYFGNPAIQYRLLLNVFLDLLGLRANDTWTASDSHYSGTDALRASHRFRTFHIGINAIEDARLRELWIDGVSRLVHRFPFYHVSCENQSSHWALYHRKLYEATGDERYRRLAEDFVAEMMDPEKSRWMATGYNQEAYGPDATYQGITGAIIALYYRMSGDAMARDGLQRVYHFFNHSVAPEPDGKVFGASGFSHRTRGSWANRQYGGGTLYMAGELPEAASWHRDTPPPLAAEEIIEALLLSEQRPHEIEVSPQFLDYATHPIGPYLRHFIFPASPLSPHGFPMEADEPFLRSFNDEFVAVRQRGYYFFGYIDGTAEEWLSRRRSTRPANPHANNSWNAVQGAQLFWTPEYGSLFTSMNWDADTIQMLRADLADGSCSFPDYWSVSSTFDPEQRALHMRQDMVDLPLTIQRRFNFHPDVLNLELMIEAHDNVRVAALYEQIPLLANKPGFELLFRREGKWSHIPGCADAFWAGNEKGAGVLVTLDAAMDMAIHEEKTFRGQRILPLRLFFPNSMENGTVETRQLSMQPHPRPGKPISVDQCEPCLCAVPGW